MLRRVSTSFGMCLVVVFSLGLLAVPDALSDDGFKLHMPSHSNKSSGEKTGAGGATWAPVSWPEHDPGFTYTNLTASGYFGPAPDLRGSFQGRICVLVKANLLLDDGSLEIRDELTQYRKDLYAEGYHVRIYRVDNEGYGDIKSLLLGYYNEKYDSDTNSSEVKGAVLIGNVAWATFEIFQDWEFQQSERSFLNQQFGEDNVTSFNDNFLANLSPYKYEVFPFDFYYMDLDAQWSDTQYYDAGTENLVTGPDPDSYLDGYTSADEELEIWTSRIKTDNLSSLIDSSTNNLGDDETRLIKKYFVKNHQYRIGGAEESLAACIFDTDFQYEIMQYWDMFVVGHLFSAMTPYWGRDLATRPSTSATRDNYLNGLASNPYQLMFVRAHGHETEQTLMSDDVNIPGNNATDSVTTSDYAGANHQTRFFFFCICENGNFRWAGREYIAGTSVFEPDSDALLAFGFAKTSLTFFEGDLFAKLNAGKSWGESYKYWQNWFQASCLDMARWTDYLRYGFVLIGDGTLKATTTQSDIWGITPPTTVNPGSQTYSLYSLTSDVYAEIWLGNPHCLETKYDAVLLGSGYQNWANWIDIALDVPVSAGVLHLVVARPGYKPFTQKITVNDSGLLHVGPSCSGHQYTSIQAAIDAASNGTPIIVHKGTYDGNLDVGSKELIITSSDPFNAEVIANTVIEGSGQVVTFGGASGPTQILYGLTIRGSIDSHVTGVFQNANNASIHSCIIDDGAASLSVGSLQDGFEYQTIQAAIDGSVAGNTIIVQEETWVENIVFPSWDITLRSVEPTDDGVVASTIIDGSGGYTSVVTLNAADTAASSLQGFTIQGGNSAGAGGGVNGNGSQASVQHCVVTSNSATGFGGGLYDCDGAISNNTITTNSAMYGGGLAHCDGLIQSNTVTSGNTATERGGGLYNCDGTISGNAITGNSAQYGGGLCYCDGPIQNNTDISDNTDTENGGGLYGCDGAISGNTIATNSAGNDGGGLYKCDGAVSGNTITGNSATSGDGGGLYGGTGTISANTITVNDAINGGGLYLCAQTVSGNTITNNTAGTLGGGFYNCHGTLSDNALSGNDPSSGGGSYVCAGTVSGNTITDNSATNSGGGLYGESAAISGNSITGNSAPHGGDLVSCNCSP